MGFRFRKSIKIAPGVRVNISKKGVSSTSIGTKGATVNLNGKGAKTTVGIPGSGLSYETKRTGKSGAKSAGCLSILGAIAFIAIVAKMCSGPSSAPPPEQSASSESVSSAAYSGGVYDDIPTDVALKRLENAGIKLTFTTEKLPDGQECRKSADLPGTFYLCSFGGYISQVKFTTLGTLPNNKPPHDVVTEAFMAVLSDEPYTKVDRARIHREVSEYLAFDDSEPRFVAMSLHIVQVIPQRVNYELIADPNVTSTLDLK